MCGIIGYISKDDNIQNTLVENLKKLEYRGYDSSGFCIISKNNFVLKKSLGKVENLKKQIDDTKSNIGIAHTRWATHGNVTLNNTHPLLSQNKTWAVVHNGIIENHLQIKKHLDFVNFCGQTDTEVVPNFLEQQNGEDNLKKIQNLTKTLVGSYALCMLNKDEKDTMYLARKSSPLFVAQNDNSVMASSDPACFGEKFKTYYVLPQNSIALVTLNNIEFFDFNLKKINIKQKPIGVFEKSSSLGNFKYFAEKEINEIPYVLQNIAKIYKNQDYFAKIDKKYLKNISKVYLIGCGTSYHACLMGAKYFQKNCKIIPNVYLASEFNCNPPPLDKNTLCIFLSQSGETADTLICHSICQKYNSKSIAIVNVPYSTLAQNCNIYLPLCAGMEIAVMSTKAYNAMLYVLHLLSMHIKHTLFGTKLNYAPLKISWQNYPIEYLSDIVIANKKIFFIGKDIDYVTALEAGLKLKEITYINCISIPSGELKHGTLSLVDKESLVFVICTQKKLLSKNLASASEIKSRGGKIVFVTNQNIQKEDAKNLDIIIKLPNSPYYLASNLSIIPFQLLAYKTCLKLGQNPDKPRNLAKSVTVE